MHKARIDLYRSDVEDVVSDKYLVHLSSQIHELSNDFAKYYLATNIDDHVEYYAIVFDKKFVPDYNFISALRNIRHEYINNVVSIGITKLSNNGHTHTVVIIEKYDPSSTLAEMYAQGKRLEKEEITNQLVSMLASVLQFCEQYGLSCGNINPANILIDSAGNFILREPFSAPANYYQSNYFLPVELSSCLALARSARVTEDVYAAGATILFAFTGDNNATGSYSTIADFNHARQTLGSFKEMTQDVRLSEMVKVLLKGMLADTTSRRWHSRNIFEWLTGKVTNLSRANKSTPGSYITFNGKNYTSVASLYNALLNDWDQALLFALDSRFHQWIIKAFHSHPCAAQVELLCKHILSADGKYGVQHSYEEKTAILVKFLFLLGEGYILSFKGFSISLFKLEQFISARLAVLERDTIKIVLHFISEHQEFLKTVIQLMATGGEKESLQQVIDIVCSSYHNDKNAISGIERVLYSLDDLIPCQSSLFLPAYIDNIPSLLVELDSICRGNNGPFTLDRHMLGFIASKAKIKADAPIELSSKFPYLAADPIITGLPILNIACSFAPDLKLPALIHIISERLIEVIENTIHNQKLQKVLIGQLLNEGENGTIGAMADLIANESIFEEDDAAYRKVLGDIKAMKDRVNGLSQFDFVHGEGVFFGQKITVLFSYILCLAVMVILVV